MNHPRRSLAIALLLALFSSAASFAVEDFYWETPAPFSRSAARFPVSAFNGDLSVVAWQEPVQAADGGSAVSVSLAVKRGDGQRRVLRNVAGPYPFTDTEPSIASVAVDGRGRILLALSATPTETEVLVSSDEGASFSRSVIRSDNGSVSTPGAVAPRIFVRSDGGYLLFATRGTDQSLSIFVSRSDDGAVWTPFAPFVVEEGMRLNFLPTHAAAGGKDIVVFQSLSSSARPTFQLFAKVSSDGGATWSPARLVTSFRDPFSQTTQAADAFDNQRPHLSRVGDSLFLVWERRVGSQAPQIYVAELTDSGTLQGEADRITSAGAYCNNPIVVDYRGTPVVFWFDNRRGQNRIYMAQRDGILWQDSDLSLSRLDSTFARPVVDSDGLFVFWQAGTQDAARLYLLEPDRRAIPPRLAAVNFTPGARTRRDVARFSWQAPDDSSGIAGYAYSWSQSPEAVPDRKPTLLASASSLELTASEDGPWYLSMISQDFAGNWSSPTRVEFVRDTTPPGRANVVLPPVDDRGFLQSNSFSVSWNPPPASDLAGYAWELEYVAPLEYIGSLEAGTLARILGLPGASAPAGLPVSVQVPFLSALSGGEAAAAAFEAKALSFFGLREPPRRLVGDQASASFVNRDDGIWRFSVSAVDTVGNVGEPTVRYFKTNKYVPYTYVTVVDAKRDDMGVFTLSIVGRGFSEGGRIERVLVDIDGKEPYDREYYLSSGDYRVETDRIISGLRLEDLPEGSYRIGLVHPRRGLYFTAPQLAVDETGTIKFGDYSKTWEPSWVRAAPRRFVLDSMLLLAAALVAFAFLGIAVSIHGIGGVIKESVAIRLEVTALITGEAMPSEKRTLPVSVKKRTGGLSLKLAAFTAVLVVAVVVLVSAPLSILMSRTQEETLVRGLKDRSRVLLESLASGARAYLPSRNVLELGFLPAQTSAIPEARYATITGFGSDATTFTDHVWATNDPDIGKKIDTADFGAGISRLEDPLTPRLAEIAKELDDRARSEVGDLSAAIAELTQEGLKLALKTDAESIRRRDDIQATTRELEARLTERLAAVSSRIGSEPAFDADLLPADARAFIFFKPVMYRQGSEDTYFRGLVRLEVGTESIREALAAGRREQLKTILSVALLAVAIGVVGALLLASLIVRPLRRLVKHVEKIRDTEDKSTLEGHEIEVRSRDEIEILGDTINDMTHGLVKAAAAAKDLTVGKDVQKMFIPLETDERGRKLISGRLDTDHANFFGYYEGAKGVSGDYFNYIKLDDRYFAIIKCDVSGKGVPAALIMVEVATLFQDHFQDWKRDAKGLNLEPLVYRINGFINSQGYKGLFAAFTMCLFDSQSGKVSFCNAGDKLVHWYDASERRLKTLELQETPAAGPFPNDLIELKTGFPMQSLTLDPGDFLLLYTDGIEEAKRFFRDPALRELVYWRSDDTFTLAADGIERHGAKEGETEKGIADEDIGYERVKEIVEAVLSRGRFELTKLRNPDPQERFVFDFTSCEGTFEEAIIALVSVEKVFRMYRDPRAGESDRVIVDRKVDEFLRGHFEQYRAYAAGVRDHSELREYVYYAHVREDAQYDDLTILGVRKR
jgi:hypothetical protein